MKLSPEVKEAIVLHEAQDPRVVARELSTRLGEFIPARVVAKVRGSLAQAANVNRAREAASSTLSDKVAVIDDVAATLLETFNDVTLPMKERIEASKELRQYLKLGMDAAGIHDANSETLFVIDPQWSALPGSGE